MGVVDTCKMFPPLSPPRLLKDEMCTEPLPSVGSQLHGLTVDSEPKCQPCAWFHKASGCRNGAACRYCHLCSEDELKTRKKQKVARLRALETEGRHCDSK